MIEKIRLIESPHVQYFRYENKKLDFILFFRRKNDFKVKTLVQLEETGEVVEIQLGKLQVCGHGNDYWEQTNVIQLRKVN